MDDNSTWDTPDNMVGRYKDPELAARREMAHNLVFQMWEAGIRDIEEIASESGYTPSYVRTLLRNRGIKVNVAHTKSAEDVQSVLDDYQSEMSIKAICRKHNISNNTLYSILDEKRIPVRRSNENRKSGRANHMDQAITMYLEHEKVKHIYAQTGISPATLYAELETRGIEMRNKSFVDSNSLDRAVELYKARKQINEIEAETGVTPSRLYTELAIRNIAVNRDPDNFTQRLNKALSMFEMGAGIARIYNETKISSGVLYRAVKHRGLGLRNKKHAVERNWDKAFELYDGGYPGLEVLKQSNVSIGEFIEALKQRGGNLRTGLPSRGGHKNVALAIQAYQQGTDIETIEMDTLVERVQLYAELRQRGIKLRP